MLIIAANVLKVRINISNRPWFEVYQSVCHVFDKHIIILFKESVLIFKEKGLVNLEVKQRDGSHMSF